jgi:hypothetical protein
LHKKVITAESLKESFVGNEVDTTTLSSLMVYHNTQMIKVLEPGTLKNYHTTAKYLKEFIKLKFKSTDVFLPNLNCQFICEFEIFLRNTAPLDHQKKLRNNGMMKHLERLRKMVRLAGKDGMDSQETV